MMLDTKIFIQHITGKFIKIKYFHFVVVIITKKQEIITEIRFWNDKYNTI